MAVRLSFWVKPVATNPALGMFTADSSGSNPPDARHAPDSAFASRYNNVGLEATFKTSRTAAARQGGSNATTKQLATHRPDVEQRL